MSSISPRTSTNDNTSSSSFRVNYSDYVADITGSPKVTRKLATTGIGHHINPLHNPYPSRQNQPIQQTGGMPQYGGSAEKCARCSKTVYIAEKKVGAGRSFHTSCFSCYTCKRKLDSSGLSEHKGEIYCKSCYTKQFGAHGLISGVTMSTEHPVTRENQNIRRSSYGNDLEAPRITNQQTPRRTNSSENIFRDEYGSSQNDELSQKYPRRYDVLSEQNSLSNKKNNGIDAIIDTKYQRPSSPIGFERVIEPNTNNNRHRSTYVEEDDRNKYIYEGEKLSYGSGTSAIIDTPVVSYPKRSNSTNDRFEIPIESTKDTQRTPLVISNDSYRRQSSHERQTDLDDYSRFNINENKNNRKYSNDNTINTIASENPLTTRDSYHSSSSYESNYRNTTSNPNNYNREQYHSQESSPSVTLNKNRSPSPTSDYISSSSTYRVGTSRDSTSPPSTYVSQHDYRNLNDRRSSSPPPQYNDQTSLGLNDFVSKTNLAGNISSSSGNKYSTLGSLINNPRQQNNPIYDDDFDN